MGQQEELRGAVLQQLKALLDGGQAHVGFEKAIADFPVELRGVRPEGLPGRVPGRVPYSGWQLLEHLRIAQRDILDFSTDDHGRGYKPMEWPRQYWPEQPEPPSESAWEESVAAYRRDREEFEELLMHEAADLQTPFPWGDGQTLLREALLIADHAAYHVGELVLLRRLLGAWD